MGTSVSAGVGAAVRGGVGAGVGADVGAGVGGGVGTGVGASPCSVIRESVHSSSHFKRHVVVPIGGEEV